MTSLEGKPYFAVAGSHLIQVEEWADEVGANLQEFMIQSLKLGVDLAEFAVDALPDKSVICFVPKKQEPVKYYLEFDEVEPVDPDTAARDVELVDFEFDMLGEIREGEVEFNPELLASARGLAKQLGTTFRIFLSRSITYRHEWGIARADGGDVVIEDGHPDGPIVVGRADFDPPLAEDVEG
jgi:hypothetical protein